MTATSERISLKHLLITGASTDREVMGLTRRAGEFKQGAKWHPEERQYLATNLLFESSTRMHKSPEVVEKKLGLEVIESETSRGSIQKGETLYGTVLTMSAIGVDVTATCHGKENYYDELIQSKTIQCSIINGEDGGGQCPTQYLLDLMTIYEEFSGFEGLKVAIVGDITHFRVAESDMQLLNRLGAKVYFSGPEEWYDHQFDVYGQYVPLDEVAEKVDVTMLPRVQHERHDGEESFSKGGYHLEYGLTNGWATRSQKHAIIMHPVPADRDVELAGELVESLQSRIVTQMSNGVFIRTMILEAVLHGKAQVEK